MAIIKRHTSRGVILIECKPTKEKSGGAKVQVKDRPKKVKKSDEQSTQP